MATACRACGSMLDRCMPTICPVERNLLMGQEVNLWLHGLRVLSRVSGLPPFDARDLIPPQPCLACGHERCTPDCPVDTLLDDHRMVVGARIAPRGRPPAVHRRPVPGCSVVRMEPIVEKVARIPAHKLPAGQVQCEHCGLVNLSNPCQVCAVEARRGGAWAPDTMQCLNLAMFALSEHPNYHDRFAA